jgi:hypothetical protein
LNSPLKNLFNMLAARQATEAVHVGWAVQMFLLDWMGQIYAETRFLLRTNWKGNIRRD